MKDRALASCLAGVLLVCGAADAADAGELCLVDNPTSGGFVDFGLLGEEVIDIGFDGAATLPLPGFPGNYVFQGPVIVGQDGGVAFGTSAPVGLCAENEPIPSSCAFDGEQAALVFWDDIDDKDSDVEYVLFEGPGNTGASLIIQWTY